jgi:hypothetical protein
MWTSAQIDEIAKPIDGGQADRLDSIRRDGALVSISSPLAASSFVLFRSVKRQNLKSGRVFLVDAVSEQDNSLSLGADFARARGRASPTEAPPTRVDECQKTSLPRESSELTKKSSQDATGSQKMSQSAPLTPAAATCNLKRSTRALDADGSGCVSTSISDAW